jgi:TolA-binding protein
MIEHDTDEEIVDEVVEEVVEEAPTPVSPDVDELEDRLRDLQGAMDQIQTGDLDAAEQAIEALEHRMESTRD